MQLVIMLCFVQLFLLQCMLSLLSITIHPPTHTKDFHTFHIFSAITQASNFVLPPDIKDELTKLLQQATTVNKTISSQLDPED